jgi:hypothetical protein
LIPGGGYNSTTEKVEDSLVGGFVADELDEVELILKSVLEEESNLELHGDTESQSKPKSFPLAYFMDNNQEMQAKMEARIEENMKAEIHSI